MAHYHNVVISPGPSTTPTPSGGGGGGGGSSSSEKKKESPIERALRKGFKSGGKIGDIGGGTGETVTSSGGGTGGPQPTSTPTKKTRQTTKQEFVKSLIERQEAKRAERTGTERRGVSVGPTGEQIVIARREAQRQVEVTPTLEQKPIIAEREKARRISQQVGGTVLTLREATRRIIKREKGRIKSIEDYEERADRPYGEKQVPISQLKTKAKEEHPRVAQYRAIGEQETFIKPISERTVELGRTGLKKAKRAAKELDISIRATVKQVIPREFEVGAYRRAVKLKKQMELGVKGPRIPGFIPIYFQKLRKVPPKAVEFTGAYVGTVRKEPSKVALTTAAFFALPPVLKGVGKLVAPIAGVFPKVSAALGKGVALGLPAIYGTSVITRTAIAERPVRELGKIGATEITPMFVGGAVGAYAWPRVGGYFKTIGRKKVEVREIVPQKVITGEATFPTAPTRKHLKIFRESRYKLPGTKKPVLYHAAPEPIKGEIIGPGTSELPGLYGAPGVSAYFLKVGKGEYKLYGGKLFEPYVSPQVAAITPKYFRFRKAVKTTKGWQWKGIEELGVADVPGIKTEVEAILPPETELIPTAKKFYFKWRGVRTPIDEYAVKGLSKFTLGKPITTFGKAYYSYRLPAKYPVTTPGAISLVAATSYKPSLISYAPSYKPSRVSYQPNRVSYRPSYKLSKVSYVTSYKPSRVSYKPSYKPSRISYFPSYKPSAKVSYRTIYPSYKVSRGTSRITTLTPPPKVPPTLFSTRIKGIAKKKKKKKLLALKGRYKPTIRAAYEDIIGPRPKVLTGLEVRPIKMRL